MESVSSTTGTELTRVRHILGLMQKNLECPICLDLLKNPVSTRCNHQFCRFCILKALTGKQSVSCPLCKEELTKRSLQDNSQLQQIITAVQSVTEAVYKDTDQQKAPPVGSSQNCRKTQEQGEKRRHISTDSEEGNGVPSTVQVRNRRNIRQAKRRKVEETPIYIEEDPVEDSSAPRTSTNINISCGFPVQELSKGRKNRNLKDSPNHETHRRTASRRTRHAARRDGRASNRERDGGQLEQTVANTELLSALVENSLGVTGDGHVTNSCHGDDDVTANADRSAEGDRLLHALGEASLGLLGQSSTENIQDPVAIGNCEGKGPTTEEHVEQQVGDRRLLSSHDHNGGSRADEGPRGDDDQKSDTLGPTISEAEPLDISKDPEQMTVDLLTTEDEVPADIGKEVKAKEKVEFWLKHHSLHSQANKTGTEPESMDDLDPYEFIGSQQDPAKGKKKSKRRGKKGRKTGAADNRNKKPSTSTKMSSSGPSKGKPGKMSAKQLVKEVNGVEEDYEELDQEEVESSAASMTDGSEASWKPGQSDPDWGKGRSCRRRTAEIKAEEESVSTKGRKRKRRSAADKEDRMTVSSGSSSQLRIDRWVQRKEKVFVKSYSKPALSRREKTLLQKKTAGLEEQWRRAKNMAGDFAAKVLHPIAEEPTSKTKKKSKNDDTPSKAPVEETCHGKVPHPLQDSPAKPSMGVREEVQNSDDDMGVYLTSNGELLDQPNSPENSDDPTEDQDPEKQPAKEKSVALTDQEQKIAADLNELDEQTLSQLGMFSQQYLQKRKRRKDRKKRFEEEQDEDEDNIFAAIRALESESKKQSQDKTSRKENECKEVVDDKLDADHISTAVETGEKTTSSPKNHSRKSRQTRSSSRDCGGEEDVSEDEEARPRRTRSSTRKDTEASNIEKTPKKDWNVGHIASKESLGQVLSKTKSERKTQDKKADGERNAKEPSEPGNIKDKGEDVTQDAIDKISKKQKEERQQTAIEEKKSDSSKELETREEDSVNAREAVTEQNVSSPKALQTRKRHAAEEQTNMKAIGNTTESFSVQETRHGKTSERRNKDEPTKHLPLVTTKDKVPQDPYQFQCSQDDMGKRAGKKRGRRQRGKVKKLKRTKARKRELLLIKAGWMEREEDGEEEVDESEEENVQDSLHKNKEADEIHVVEPKDAQAKVNKQEDQDISPPVEEMGNTEVSVIPESNPNTELVSSSLKTKKRGVFDLTPSQQSCLAEDTPGIYSTEIIPPSVEEAQTKSPQANKNKRKTLSHKKTGENTKLSTSGKGASQETENSEDIIGPSWQEKEEKQPNDKIYNKPENVTLSEGVQDQNVRRSPRHSPKNALAKEKDREEGARKSVRHSTEKDKDGQQDILNSPRRKPKKPWEEQEIRRSPRHNTRKSLAGVMNLEQDANASPRHSPEKDKDGQQDILNSPRHKLKKPWEEQEIRRSPRHSTHKSLAGVMNPEQDANISPRHSPEQHKDGKQNLRSSPRRSLEKALDQDKAEEVMVKSPRHETEKATDKYKSKTGKRNLHLSGKEKITAVQDFGNVVRNIPDTITLASPTPPRRHFAGVAGNTRSRRTGEGPAFDLRDEEEFLSSPASQDTSLENSMEDCVAIPESETTTTEFEGKLVEVVADVHRLAEFSEGSQRIQTQNKLRKASCEIQSPEQQVSQRTPASLRSSGKESTPGEVPPTPPPSSTPPISTSGQKVPKDRNRLSTRRRRSQLRSPESTPSDRSTALENTPSTPALLKSLAACTKSQPKSCATPTVSPDVVDSGKDTPKSCLPESDVSTVCSQVTTQRDDTEHKTTAPDSNVVPDSEENATSKKGKRKSSHLPNTSSSESSPKTKPTSPSAMLPQSFPESGNTEASVSLLENVKLQPKAAETVSEQKRKSPRLSKGVSDIGKNEKLCKGVTQNPEQNEAEQTNSGSHLKKQIRRRKGEEGKADDLKLTENVVGKQATLDGQDQQSEENKDLDLTEEAKQDLQVEDNEQEVEDVKEEDSTENDDDEEEEEEEEDESEEDKVKQDIQVEDNEQEVDVQEEDGTENEEDDDYDDEDDDDDSEEDEVKQDIQVEDNKQAVEDVQEEDGTENDDDDEDEDDDDDDESEEDDLVPPTPPDTSFTQLTQRAMTVKSKTRIPERFAREDAQENYRQPVVIEEDENRECSWSDDDDDELPDLDDEPRNQLSSPTCHSDTATPQNSKSSRAEKQSDVNEAFNESHQAQKLKDTDVKTRSQSKRRKETSGQLDMEDEATDDLLPKRRKSKGNPEPELEERILTADVVDVTACLENNEESDLSQDSHTHDLTNASSLSELYDTQHQDKLKNDVQHLEGQMAMIQMLLAKGKERAKEKGKEENTNDEQHLTTTAHEKNMQVSEGDREEILSGKDLYGTPSSQASAKDIYSTAHDVTTPRKLRSSSTPSHDNHSPTKEYNFRKRVASPQRSQEVSAKSRKSRLSQSSPRSPSPPLPLSPEKMQMPRGKPRKSRLSQSSPRSSQPCLSPRSPSPPLPLSPEKMQMPRGKSRKSRLSQSSPRSSQPCLSPRSPSPPPPISPEKMRPPRANPRKSRLSQSSPRSSQPCLSPRSPSPPPPLSLEKTRAPRVLPRAVQAAASILEKFKSPDVSAEGKEKSSGNSTPLEKEDATTRRLSPKTKEGSISLSERKNITPRSSSCSKKSNSKSHTSPRRKKYDIEKRRDLVDNEGRGDDDTVLVEDIVPTVVKNRRSLNRRKSNSLKDAFADEEEETVTRCDDVMSPAHDNNMTTSGEFGEDVSEPEEVSTNWKAFQQMKCDILAQKGPSPNKNQSKEAPKRLSLPCTQKPDKSSSNKRKSEPSVPSSQFDRNNPSTPQPRKTPLTFSQQPSPSVRKLFQNAVRSKESPRLRSSNRSPIRKANTERSNPTSSVKSTGSTAGQTTAVKNEWEDNNHVPMTFVTTGLSKEETRAVHELAKKTGSRVKQTFDNSTTHVITRTDVDLFCSRTLKFFLGIAGRKWIVSFQWISACLEEGKQVPEEPYEVRGDLVHGCHGGPRQARNNKGKLLLSDYEICIYGKFTALTRDDLQFMVELCGGTVIKEPHMFPHDKKPLIVSQIDANQLTEEDYNAFYRRYGVLSVTRDWILDSVSSYQIQPIDRYLMCSTRNQNVIVID